MRLSSIVLLMLILRMNFDIELCVGPLFASILLAKSFLRGSRPLSTKAIYSVAWQAPRGGLTRGVRKGVHLQGAGAQHAGGVLQALASAAEGATRARDQPRGTGP